MFWWRQPLDSKMQLSYSVVFLIRRVVFVYLIFMHNQGTQIIVTAFLFGLISFYIAEYKPKRTRHEWYLELYNEFFISSVLLHFALMTDHVVDPEYRFKIGWSIIFHISMLLAPNLASMIYYAVRYTKIVIRRFYWWAYLSRYRMNKKWLANRNEAMEQMPEVNVFHVATRHFLFKSTFFKDKEKIKESLPEVNTILERYAQQVEMNETPD